METDVGLILIARENHSLVKAHVSLPSLCALTDCGRWDRPLAVWPCKGKKGSVCSACSWKGWATTNPELALQVLLCRIHMSKARGGGAGGRNIPLAGHYVGLHGFLGLPLRDAREKEMVRERTEISGKLPTSLPHRSGFSHVWWCLEPSEERLFLSPHILSGFLSMVTAQTSSQTSYMQTLLMVPTGRHMLYLSQGLRILHNCEREDHSVYLVTMAHCLAGLG